MFDSTNCHGVQTSLWKERITEVATPAVTYDAQAAGDCVAQLKGVIKCGNTATADGIDACNHIFQGSLAAGQPCTSSSECKSPGYCSSDISADGSQSARVCMVSSNSVTATRGKAGDNCDVTCNDAADCTDRPFQGSVLGAPSTTPVACYRSDGLYCAGTCEKLHGVGEICDSFGACQEGLFCPQDTNRCTAPHPDGASCRDRIECQSDFCSADGVCGSSSVTSQQCANGATNSP